jgi:ATP-dependent DNA helicase RecG
VVDAISRRTTKGDRVYWVCPLIDESEVLDLAAATDRYDALSHILGERVGLIHGAMKGKERGAVMARFASGEITVLVATTVIEVGVDVPEATMMVVEYAERFGLSQLHQLRGRIGRGERESLCLLLYAPPLSKTALARLEILRASDDGFHIAEEDLRLRGAGEVLGTRQSGLPEFRLLDLAEHGDLLAAARDDARLILNSDPGLESPRGEALKVMLYLFERDSVVKYARSG